MLDPVELSSMKNADVAPVELKSKKSRACCPNVVVLYASPELRSKKNIETALTF
jgi:hypothetical protein